MIPRPSRAALAVVLLAAACGGGSSHSTSGTQPINDGGTMNAKGKSMVRITATNFKFSPSTIIATPGQVLKLVVTNTSSTQHNISQKAQNVNQDLDPNATRTVMLTVPTSGRLIFFCEYHHARGMAGSIGPAGSTAPVQQQPASPNAPYGNGG